MRSVDRVKFSTTRHISTIGGGCGLLLALYLLPATAQAQQNLPARNVTASVNTFAPGQKVKLKGLIISRNGDDMTVRDETNHLSTVTLVEGTHIYTPNTGLFKLEKKRRDVTSLLPGLIVEIHGQGGDSGNLIADRISFQSSALKVASQISAGEVELERRVSANEDSISAVKMRLADSIDAVAKRTNDSLASINVRFDDIDKYSSRDSTTVNFATGKYALSDESKQSLDGLIAKNTGLSGYLVEVTGFADTTGTSQTNFVLSDHRAQMVVDYLVEHGVPLRRILNPTGLGARNPVASNATPDGRAQNRRAEVKILVNDARRPQ